MSTAALRPQPERPCATAALRVFELVGVRALRVRVRPGPGRSRCRTAWPGWSHAMTGFLDSTSACGSIGRRGGIEFSNGVIIDSNLGVECELVRRAFWTNPQQVDHPLLAALGAHCPAFVGLPALNGQYGQMRVGTWNLAGRWSPHHLELLLAQECDVWLLTEVRADVSLPSFESHLTAATMAPRRHWAGIYSRTPLQPRPDPHPASAAAFGLGLTWCSSILPWRSCGTVPWGDGAASEKTRRALDQLASELPVGALIWGGDWNHAMQGREYAGSVAGRTAIKAAVVDLQLTLATEDSPHCIPGLLTIDHIAVPRSARIHAVNRIVAEDRSGKRLSDHDAYAIDVTVS